MVNPFQFGKVVRDKQFCNRQRELHDLTSTIKNGNSLWLYSPRRYGKTSLIINVFSRIENVKTIYFDLFNIRDNREFATKYLNVLTHELFTWKHGVTSILKKFSDYLKNITPTVSLDAMGNPSIGLDIKPKEISRTIESILELPQKLNYSKPICIAFDEFQEVERLDPFLKNIMRSVFQHQQNVSYIFLGSKESLRNEFSNLQKDVRTLRRSRDLYAEKLELAAENLNMAQEQFKLGMISLIDLDRSQLEYRNTQLSYNNRHYSLIRKQEELNLLLSKKILGKW